jgi:hypothetical protein
LRIAISTILSMSPRRRLISAVRSVVERASPKPLAAFHAISLGFRGMISMTCRRTSSKLHFEKSKGATPARISYIIMPIE